jgi:hypothetical protein
MILNHFMGKDFQWILQKKVEMEYLENHYKRIDYQYRQINKTKI